jgi:hypothetical protein
MEGAAMKNHRAAAGGSICQVLHRNKLQDQNRQGERRGEGKAARPLEKAEHLKFARVTIHNIF